MHVNNIPLIYAAEHGDIVTIQSILHIHGININEQNADGYTAAIMAAMKNNCAMLEVLINAGADLSLRARNGLCALDWANIHNSEKMINLIKQKSSRRHRN